MREEQCTFLLSFLSINKDWKMWFWGIVNPTLPTLTIALSKPNWGLISTNSLEHIKLALSFIIFKWILHNLPLNHEVYFSACHLLCCCSSLILASYPQTPVSLFKLIVNAAVPGASEHIYKPKTGLLYLDSKTICWFRQIHGFVYSCE